MDILKIDIEGAEVEAFVGDTEWLAMVRTIAIEFHGDSRVTCRFDDLMEKHNFMVHSVAGHTVVATRR